MSRRNQPNQPVSRDGVQSRLRLVTRVAVLAATGATVAIGVVVAHDHPGASVRKSTSSGSGSTSVSNATGGGTTSSSTGNGGNSGNTGITGNTGSSAPSASTSTPTVTSGGSSS